MLTIAVLALIIAIILIWTLDTDGVKIYVTLVAVATICVCLFCLRQSIKHFRNQQRLRAEVNAAAAATPAAAAPVHKDIIHSPIPMVTGSPVTAGSAIAQGVSPKMYEQLKTEVGMLKNEIWQMKNTPVPRQIPNPPPSNAPPPSANPPATSGPAQAPTVVPAPPSYTGVDPPSNLPSPDLRHMIERAWCDDHALYRFTPPPPIQLPPES